MTKLITKISLSTTDMFTVPVNLSDTVTVVGVGDGQSYNKTTSPTYAVGVNPTALPIGAFSSDDKKVYIYLINKSEIEGEDVNVYILESGGAYGKIAILAPKEYLYIPLANNSYLYTDAIVGTPTIEFLILEK